MNKNCKVCINHDARFWKFLDTVCIRVTNSGSLNECFWLEYVKWCWRKLLKSFLCLESPCTNDFRIEFYGENFKFANVFLAQLSGPFALGLWSWLCSEAIRSTKLTKISCNHWFGYLIFHHYIFNLFHVLLYQLCSNQTKSSYFWMCTNYWE